MSIRESSSDFSMLLVMTPAPIPQKPCGPSSSIERPHGIERAKSIVVAVRSFIRFLGATGRCPAGREHAIPGFASWRLSSVPGSSLPKM